jgi:hypothetical protein
MAKWRGLEKGMAGESGGESEGRERGGKSQRRRVWRVGRGGKKKSVDELVDG